MIFLSDIKMQKIVHYNQDICFGRVLGNPDQYYDAKFYRSQVAFDINPNEDVIIVLRNCGDSWFRHGMTHAVKLVDGSFAFTGKCPRQLCLYIRNYSSNAEIHVEAGTPLAYLLAQSEIIFKLVHIPLQDFNLAHGSLDSQDSDSSGIESGDDENVQKIKNVDNDDDLDHMYYVRISNQ